MNIHEAENLKPGDRFISADGIRVEVLGHDGLSLKLKDNNSIIHAFHTDAWILASELEGK